MNEHAFYLDPELWVAASFVLFFLLFYRPLLRALYKTLDTRSQLIEQELEEARHLRNEAETILAAYRQKQQDSLQESEAILTAATKEAAILSKQAEVQAHAILDKRVKLALEKIAQAEAHALKEVQEHVSDIAVSVARSLIIEHVKQTGDMEVVREAAMELERKLH